MSASAQTSTAWWVPYRTKAERAANLRLHAAMVRAPEARAALDARAERLESESLEESAERLALPMVERAPALVRWAEKVQRDRSKPLLERAAAHEVEALAWEEAGFFAHAARARRNAALELGARLDVAGFHTDADAPA